MRDNGRWIIELGVGEWDLGAEVVAHDRGVAVALARMARGLTLADVERWAGAELMVDTHRDKARPVVAAAVVYYDGEETRHDTHHEVWAVL